MADTGELIFEAACITFQRDADEMPDDYSAADYAGEIRALLESLPTVSNVAVEGVETFKLPTGDNWTGHMAVVKQPVPIVHPTFMCPHPIQGTVSFTIHIPDRIQRELIAERTPVSPPSTPLAERFEVVVCFTAFWPAAYIRALDSTGEIPFGVFAVREFMGREIENRGSDQAVRVEFVAPSPFHGSFSLAPTADIVGADTFRVERVTSPHAWDHWDVEYDSKVFSDTESAYVALRRAASDRIGLAYGLSRHEEAMMLEWVDIADRRREIVRLARGSGVRGAFGRLLRLGGRTRELSLKLFELEGIALSESALATRALQDLKADGSPELIETDLERAVTEAFRARDSRATEVVQYVEGRRAHEVNVLVVLVAAAVGFFGGVAGSLLAVAVQGG